MTKDSPSPTWSIILCGVSSSASPATTRTNKSQKGLDIPQNPDIMDTMKATQYLLKNPYTGDELVRCDASELNGFLSYFRGLIGVWDIPFEVVA